jgi:hypothetical protein
MRLPMLLREPDLCLSSESKGMSKESVKQSHDDHRELPTTFPLVGFHFLGTLLAHRPTHHIAKLAIR